MQENNNQQDIPPQSGYDELANALTSLAQNVMRNTVDLGNRVQDAVCRGLIDIVQGIDRQLTEQINEIGNTAVNQVNSTLQSADIRLNHEIASASEQIQSQVSAVGNRAQQSLRVMDEAEADISDDEDNNLQRNMGRWANRTRSNNTGNHQGF